MLTKESLCGIVSSHMFCWWFLPPSKGCIGEGIDCPAWPLCARTRGEVGDLWPNLDHEWETLYEHDVCVKGLQKKVIGCGWLVGEGGRDRRIRYRERL
jgi:hypothetical protein